MLSLHISPGWKVFYPLKNTLFPGDFAETTFLGGYNCVALSKRAPLSAGAKSFAKSPPTLPKMALIRSSLVVFKYSYLREIPLSEDKIVFWAISGPESILFWGRGLSNLASPDRTVPAFSLISNICLQGHRTMRFRWINSSLLYTLSRYCKNPLCQNQQLGNALWLIWNAKYTPPM